MHWLQEMLLQRALRSSRPALLLLLAILFWLRLEPATGMRSRAISQSVSGALPFDGTADLSPVGQAATTLMDRFCKARLRWFSSRIFLRKRRFFGVASTYSSGPIYSRARSRDI